jgi:probable phosphoglycerate mutase
LRRAADTAEELLKAVRAQASGIKSTTDARLREIELCQWEGLRLEEIPRRFPEQYRDWRLRPDEFHMVADTEVQYPVRGIYDRVRSFWNDLLTTYAGKSILLVTHGGTIRALVTSALGIGAGHFHSLQQSNCGLSRLRVPPNSRQAKLDLLNDTAHLGERLPKLKEGRHGVRLLLIPVEDTNPEAVRRLAAALESVVIDNLLVVGLTAGSVANQLLTCRPDSCPTVSEAAVDTIVNQALRLLSCDQLRQVAILGPQVALRRALQHQLAISDTAAEFLELRPLEITSVHHAGGGVPPVLQAMNMLNPLRGLVEA